MLDFDFEKALEVASKEDNKGFYLFKGLDHTKRNKYTDLVIDDLSFICTKKNNDELIDFKRQLIEAGIKEFTLIETSTALMEILHAFDSVGLKMNGVKTVQKEFSFSEKGYIMVDVKGLSIVIE